MTPFTPECVRTDNDGILHVEETSPEDSVCDHASEIALCGHLRRP